MKEEKKYMDIQHAREKSEFSDGNMSGFEVGDDIVIQEKVDGANASFSYNIKTGELDAYSQNNKLNYASTLRGFWNWIRTLDAKAFEAYPDYVFFGEWLVKHTVGYKKEAYDKWYMYDVFDKAAGNYLPQEEVKKLAGLLGLIYVDTFYVGKFISWDHVKSFVGKSDIAVNCGEGVVVKNMTKFPFYLKIVGEEFKETKHSNHRQKVEDPQKLKAKEFAQSVVDDIVTEARVRKHINKMIDEGIVPERVQPSDMKTVAQNLPKMIYDDCVKEEYDRVVEAGEPFGKLCGGKTMQLARAILLG